MKLTAVLFALNMFCLAQTPAVAPQFSIVQITISGNSKFSAEEVIQASALSVGQMAERRDFDGAVLRLMGTGMFRSVNYRYAPKNNPKGEPGYALNFSISEEPATQPTVLDFPGIEERDLRADLKKSTPLIQENMPANSQAEAYYRNALITVLKKRNAASPVSAITESDINTGVVATVFQPTNLPRIREIQFIGNKAIGAKTLRDTIADLAIGENFTDRSFRQKLELNVRPLYEDQAMLAVRFGKIDLGQDGNDVVLTIPIDEGPQWILGRVSVTGDPQAEELRRTAHFPEGKLATSKAIGNSMMEMEKPLKHDGYIAARFKSTRSFHPETTTVDLAIEITRGPQFTFGELQISGLSDELRLQALARFKLASGAPMDPYYVDDYLKSTAQFLADRIRGIAQELKARSGTRTVDVLITFK